MSYGNGIKLTAGFDVGAKTPLDSKSVVQTIAERDAFVTDNLVYEGLEVYVKDTGHKYRYNGTSWIDLDTQSGSESGTGEGLTTEQINQLTSAYEHSQTPHVSADDIPTNISELNNDSGYLTSHQDISNLQPKTDNNLTTTSKEVVGAINEVNGNSLDTVGFSADYKNIILNRKNGLNPYTIPISAVINNASLAELKDVDSTDVGNGKILVYDGATNKHKYVDSSITDEFVKMDSTTNAKHLSDLIDKSTVVNDNGVLKVKRLDGQEVTITEINYLKGLTMNVMDLVNAFSNGSVKVLNTPLNTASELDTMDRTSFIDGVSYVVYVLADENHSGAKTTYLVDKTNTTFFGNADNQRNFTTNPIDLANEVTGKLDNSHIDIDSLWTLLTINDTYKTLTTNNEIFSTHGAKAMYDELLTEIGAKVNATNLTTHTNDADIHVTTTDKAKWDKVDKKVDKTDIVDNLTSTDTDKPLSANQGMLLKSMIVTLTGVVLPYAGNSVPDGFLLCNGQAVSRTKYQNLFDVIGTTYGEGDGSTTFNLPNLQNKFIEGAGTNTVGTEMSAGLPNITGRAGHFPSNSVWNKILNGGAFKGYGNDGSKCPNVTPLEENNISYFFDFDASRSNSIYGNSNTVQPPAVVMNYIIKY